MSLVRNTADGIADLVVRYASPGSKEWALAMKGELVCIESDWRALAWALSGMRVLFAIRPSPLRTIENLNAEAQKYADLRRHAMNNGWIGTNGQLIVASIYILRLFFQIAFGHQILSSTVQLSGWLLLTPMIYLRTREPNVPDRDDQTGLVRFYVDELRTTSNFSLTFWMFVVGALLLIAGLELEIGLGWWSLLPLLVLPVLAYFLAKHCNNRRRFAQIQPLLGITLPD